MIGMPENAPSSSCAWQGEGLTGGDSPSLGEGGYPQRVRMLSVEARPWVSKSLAKLTRRRRLQR